MSYDVTNEAERMEEDLRGIADTIRGYLLVAETAHPDGPFGFGEAKRILREQMERADASAQEYVEFTELPER